MRVLVCGGRSFTDMDKVSRVLADADAQEEITLLIHGNARGADALAASWAIRNRILTLEYPADWATHAKSAGPIRNQRMLGASRPDLVIAFPGGRGTADMVKRARKAGIRVLEVK